MNRSILSRTLIVLVVSLCTTVIQAQVLNESAEFRVNTWSNITQEYHFTAMDDNGNFVIVWQSYGEDGSGHGISAQRYDASGTPVAAEFRVNTYTNSDQSQPSIAMDDNGDFVITWRSYGQDGSGWGIYAQRYTNSGAPAGGEFRVNTYTTSDQHDPTVGMDGNGNFVIAWISPQDGSNYGIYAQRYNASGAPLGGEFLVNTYTSQIQYEPSLAMDDNGRFVIAWESTGQDGSATGIYAQLYDASGAPAGGEFRVNTYTTSDQESPSAAMDDSGNYVITWQSLGQDGSNYGIYAQRYTASGFPLGGEFQVNTSTNVNQYNPSVAMDNDGDFIITWLSYKQQDSSPGIYAQRYDGTGSKVASEFRVNTNVYSYQNWPTAAMSENGHTVISWGNSMQQTSGWGIYAKCYSITQEPTSTSTVMPIPSAEFRVNTYSTGNQVVPSIGIDDIGNFVIAWASDGQDGSGYGIFAQRYDSFGKALGDEFRVNTHTNLSQVYGRVAMSRNGNFVVIWNGNTYDGTGWGVYAQRFDALGNKIGDELFVNYYINPEMNGFQEHPAVAIDDNGNFVVTWLTWKSDGSGLLCISAQRYNASTESFESKFQANTSEYFHFHQQMPSVAMNKNGDFIIVWASRNQDGSAYGIYAQRYNASGSKIGNEFLVNTYTSGDQTGPSAAIRDNGDFIITWISDGQDGSGWGAYAQWYDSSGSPKGNEFRLNSYTNLNQGGMIPLKISGYGDYILAWSGNGQGGVGIYAQRYNSLNNPIDSEFRVDNGSGPDPQHVTMAMNDNGTTVFAWSRNIQNSSGWEIYAKGYFLNPEPTPTLTPTATNTPIIIPTNTFTNTPTPIPTIIPTPIPTPDLCCEEILEAILINRGLILSASDVILGKLDDWLVNFPCPDVDLTPIRNDIMATNGLIHSASHTLLDEIKASRSDIGMASASLHDELDLLQRQLTSSSEVLSASIGSIQIPPLLKEDLIREINENEVKIDAASRNLDIRIGDLSQSMQTSHQDLLDAVNMNRMRIESASAAILAEFQKLPWDKMDKKLDAVSVDLQAQSAEIQSASGILNTKVNDLFTSVESGNGSILTKLTDAELGIQENIDAVQNALLAQVSQSATDVLDALDSFEMPVDIVVDAIRENRAVIDNATAYLDNRVTQVEGQLSDTKTALSSDITTAKSSLQSTLAQTGDLIEQARVDVMQKVENLTPVLSGITDAINENETLIDTGTERILAQLQNPAERIESATEYIELLVEDLRDEIDSSEDTILTELDATEQGLIDTIDNQSDRLSNQIDQSTLSIMDAVGGLQTPIQSILPEVNENQAKIAEATEYLDAQIQAHDQRVQSLLDRNAGLIQSASAAILQQVDFNSGLILGQSALIQSASQFLDARVAQVDARLENARQLLLDLQTKAQQIQDDVNQNEALIGSASDFLSAQIRGLLPDLNGIGAILFGLTMDVGEVKTKTDQVLATLDIFNERDIEDHLIRNDVSVLLFLPSQFGGELEKVRTLVENRMQLVQAAGISIRNAQTQFDNGDANYNNGKYYEAFINYSSAYRELTKVPK